MQKIMAAGTSDVLGLLIAALFSVGAAYADQVCVGDCDESGRVTINELVLGVRINLEVSDVDACTAFDADGNDRVSVGELVRGINNNLFGCGEVVPPEFEAADGIHGGELYDKFWKAAGFDEDDPNFDAYDEFGNFFRCKQCHAWDRLGNAASYIDRAPKTTRPNVSGVDLASHASEESIQGLFDAIKFGSGAPRRSVDEDLSTYDPATEETREVGDRMPDYREILSDEQIWDLVKYLKEDVLDTRDLYVVMTEGTYPTGSRSFSDWGSDGDPIAGDALYAGACAGCHGANGVGGAFPIEDGDATVGSLLRSKPYELWHKVKFGIPGDIMGPQGINTLEDMQDLYRALADPNMYPDP